MKIFILLIWIHFVFDFVFQTDWMAQNKSTKALPLSIHVLVYSSPFFFFGWRFGVITFLCHWLTDFFTSKWTAALWKAGRRHEFFVVIGFDQALHATTILLTARYLGVL